MISMVRPLFSCLGAQVRDALRPTILAVLWCSFLVVLKRSSLAESPPSWPTRARTFIDASNLSAPAAAELDWDKAWKDLDWAAYRVMASLSTVTGLLLAFRSNSAIDRWSTARRKWSDVQATSRSLLRLLSASLLARVDVASPPDTVQEFAVRQADQAKVEATLATIPFFSISLMYEMRGRRLELVHGSNPSLLRSDLIAALPPALVAAANRRHSDAPQRTADSKQTEHEKRRQMQNIDSPHIIRPLTRSARDEHGSTVSTNLALSALVLLQQSIDGFHAKPATSSTAWLSGPVYAHSIGLLNSLSVHMTELERIRDTPIPLAVSSHFSRLLSIHTCLLALVVVQRLYESWWLCAGIVGVVTGMLYGVDSFAATLSQPFGLDREDLPLEKYTADAQREWDEVRASCNETVGLTAGEYGVHNVG